MTDRFGTGLDILDDNFGGEGSGAVGTIVFRVEQGVDDPHEPRDGEGGDPAGAPREDLGGVDEIGRAHV